MIKGRIIKAIAGFYYVHSEDLLLTCKARGAFKKKGISPLVGDIVSVSRQGMHEGIIEAIDPRKNEIIRPKIANIDQVALVFSLASPQTSLFQIDKMLILEGNLNELNGVSFSKGCYVGQELTARMKHRGKVRKRLLPVRVEGPLPPPDTPVLDGAKEIGIMRSGFENQGITFMRLEDITWGKAYACGEAKVTPWLPDWLRPGTI